VMCYVWVVGRGAGVSEGRRFSFHLVFSGFLIVFL